jgi:large subunit ribosomal protein L2
LITKSGRNFTGKICVHHRKGLTIKKYYKIDFYRRINSYGYLFKIIYNTNRTSYIGGIFYENGLISYIILAEKIKLGDKIYSGVKKTKKNKRGNTNEIKNIKLFNIINNIELNPYKGAKLIRAAGTSAILTAKEKNKINLKLKSG